MSTWIELHTSLPNHWKLRRLAKKLRVKDRDLVRAKLENLWLWAIEYRENGRLTGLDEAEIAEASHWSGDATLWLRSLVECGFIDKSRGGKDGSTLQLHDWWDFAGKLIELRKKNRERKRRARHADIPVTGRGSPGLPNLTGPDPTVPNLTQPDHTTVSAHASELASAYLRMNPGIISPKKAAQLFDFAIARGAPEPDLRQAVHDEARCKGFKIWEVFEPFCPERKTSNGGKSWLDEVIEQVAKESSDAK